MKSPSWLIWFFLALAFVGFLDATYLTVMYFQGGPIPCYILSGCDTVTTSRYSHIGPVPISLLGAGYYLVIFLLAFNYLITGSNAHWRLAAHLTWLGLITSVVLMYLQFFVLQSLCLYCIISAIVSVGLFTLGRIMLKLRNE